MVPGITQATHTMLQASAWQRAEGTCLAMTSSCALLKKVPVEVRTVESTLLPVSLSTTVDLVMRGLACTCLGCGQAFGARKQPG